MNQHRIMQSHVQADGLWFHLSVIWNLRENVMKMGHLTAKVSYGECACARGLRTASVCRTLSRQSVWLFLLVIVRASPATSPDCARAAGFVLRTLSVSLLQRRAFLARGRTRYLSIVPIPIPVISRALEQRATDFFLNNPFNIHQCIPKKCTTV